MKKVNICIVGLASSGLSTTISRIIDEATEKDRILVEKTQIGETEPTMRELNLEIPDLTDPQTFEETPKDRWKSIQKARKRGRKK